MKTRLSNNLRTIWARSYVRIVGANRELSWVFFEIFLPLLNVSAYVFVYRALNAPPEYEGFVIIGGSMLAYWLNVLWNMASQFYWEKEMGHRSQLDPPCNLLCVCHSQRPLFASLILVFIYKIIVRGDTGSSMFELMFVGNAFFVYVTNTLSGVAQMVFDDREHYQMLKYIYLALIRMYWYIMGRSAAQITISTLAVVVTLAAGILVFDLNLAWHRVDWPFLMFGIVSGLLATLAIGVLLAGIALVTAMHSFGATEGVAGVFFLASGCIYPIDILPQWLQALAKILPFTYWMEIIRRSVIGERLSPVLTKWSDGELVMIMSAATVGLVILSHFGFTLCEHGARKWGKIDQKTDH